MLHLRTANGINFFHNGESKSISTDDARYNEILASLGDDAKLVSLLFQLENSAKKTEAFGVFNGNLIEKATGEGMPTFITERLKEHEANGVTVRALENFWYKLKDNPNVESQASLLDFMERNHLPLTMSGNIVLWKGLNKNYTDKYTGKIPMNLGTEIDWTKLFPTINPTVDRSQSCATSGFHCGSLEYASSFGDKVVEVEVNPLYVLSVPINETSWKMRVSRFFVKRDSRFKSGDKIPLLLED